MPLRALWRRRPTVHTRGVWALLLALDYLPWPWGEDILANLFGVVALVRPSRRRCALSWAAHHPARGQWRLAFDVGRFRGRWVAQSALLGIRDADAIRRHVVLHGAEHLGDARATILLGFHLGPPNADVALRVLGYRLAWFGNTRCSRTWSRPGWRALLEPDQSLAPPDGQRFWPGYLHRARRILLDGGTIAIKADAWAGREFCRIAVPGAVVVVRAGWVMLQRQTGARVLPVVSHLAGRDHVITIHPPLPDPAPDDSHLDEWKARLTALVLDYVGRRPEQCPTVAFPDLTIPEVRAIAAASEARV